MTPRDMMDELLTGNEFQCLSYAAVINKAMSMWQGDSGDGCANLSH